MMHAETVRRPTWVGYGCAWGEKDYETNRFNFYTEDGRPWFVLDGTTLEEIRPPAEPCEPFCEAKHIAFLHAEADKAETRSVCYFIAADEGPIKIGHSIDVHTRLKNFQLGCPVKLKILATTSGGENRETAYHWQFQDHRVHGEWFERHPDILAEIERLTPFPAS